LATSRTGTGQYKRWRHDVLRAGQAEGVTHCPLCSVPLDYSTGRQPNSAEPDHIQPHSLGGRNVVENGRVICRLCNQRRGNATRERKTGKRIAAKSRTIKALVEW
jgi:5-methylcytosine-specific restriction endonuclease McrA